MAAGTSSTWPPPRPTAWTLRRNVHHRAGSAGRFRVPAPRRDDPLPAPTRRCTGSAANSTWVGSTCAEGEYNAGSYYNVYGIINNCGTRVWLHEYTYPADTNPANPGWADCSAPDSVTALSGPIFPENIMVSANSATCSF